MNNKTIITIGRQFGSGGRAIGKLLAEKLKISYYDRELITLAAKESGLCAEVFEQADEKTSRGLAYAFSTGFSLMGIYTPYQDILSNERLFQLQSDTIRNLADKESCVLVGRCADYILRDNPDCLSFFIHCKDEEQRINNIIERQQITEDKARELITKSDKSRAAYYNYYTNKIWGHASSYNFSIDSSVLGIEGSVDFISNLVERIKVKS